MQFGRAFDGTEMVLAGHGDGGLAVVAAIQVVIRIGMRLQQRHVHQVSRVVDLPGYEPGFVVLSVGVSNSLHPLRRFQPAVVAVHRMLRLVFLRRAGLQEAHVLELAPYLGQRVRHHVAPHIVNHDILLPHVRLVDQLPHHGQYHLRG